MSSVVNEFYSEHNPIVIPKNYEPKMENPPGSEDKSAIEQEQIPLNQKVEADKEEEEEQVEFCYNEQLHDLWQKLTMKVIEKMSDTRRVYCDDLKLIQGRHRQFYKMQLQKENLDKFEPTKEVKKDKALEKDGAKKDKKKKGQDEQESEIEKKKNKRIQNFNMTLLMYED